MKKRAGYSLLEVMVAFGLFLLIMGLIASLVGGYAHIMNASDRHDSSLEGARLAIESVRRDVEATARLLEPAVGSGTAHPVLRLLRNDPEDLHLPETFPGSPPSSWDPYDPAAMVEVRYQSTDRTLWREAEWADGTIRRTRVADDLFGFSVESQPNEVVVIRCTTVALGGHQKPLEAKALMRCRSLW